MPPHIGIILQEPTLIPYLTLRENIMTATLVAEVAARLQTKADKLGVAHLLFERP